jgi:FlaA1/EpsC-like NDP-sugar epimerase
LGKGEFRQKGVEEGVLSAGGEAVMEEKRGWSEKVVARLRRDVLLALMDSAVVVVAFLIALVLRFDGSVPSHYWDHFWMLMPGAALLYLLVNQLLGLYGQMWRYASIQEARRVVLAGAVSGVLMLIVGEWVRNGTRPLPLSVIILGATLAPMGFGAIRFQSRIFAFKRRDGEAERSRVLVVGAGEAGAMILRDIQRNKSLDLDPVAVVNDDPRKVGRVLGVVPILGTRAAIPSLVASLAVDQVLLAIPSAPSEVIREVADLCQQAHVALKVVPSVREIVGGRVTAGDIRDLSLEDLLGRQQVETDLESVRSILHGRRVLVTGGGGSIGTEIARQVAAFEPSALILVDHDETHLHDALADLDPAAGAEAVLADIRNQDRVLGVFMRYRPEVVFHAAAHKHVPLLETHPEEALHTNVIGTANVADAAVATGVKRFVLISTDKAIKPASVMGASKWFSEQIVRSLHGGGCTFCAVRFGNVLGSRGSVVPTFLRQIARGGPVTVTDPAMSRYFMSVQEAVQLVLQAGALSLGGEVFTLDMGEPKRILDLAEKVILLSGRVPEQDVKIAIVGQRPGEKLAEDLVESAEEQMPSEHPKVIVSRPPLPDPALLRQALWELEAFAREGRSEELALRMKGVTSGRLEAVAAGGVA